MAYKAVLRFLYMCLLYREKSLWYLSKVGLKIYLSESRKSTISSAQSIKWWVEGVYLRYMFSLSSHHTSFVLTKCSHNLVSGGDFKLHLVFVVLLSRSNATTRADYGEPCRAKTAKRLFDYEQVANADCEYPLDFRLVK